MSDAVATDGPPPRTAGGVGVSDGARVPALPTVLLADADLHYRAMVREALLEGREATDVRTVGSGAELLAYLGRSTPTLAPAPAHAMQEAA